MGQPTPPGDLPLYDGLGAEWNDVFGVIPEDKRGEIGAVIKSRISDYDNRLNSYKNWDDVVKTGNPDQVKTALGIYNLVENRPQEVYELLGRHLGISTQQAKEVAETVEGSDSDDPRIVEMQKRIDTMTQIMLAQKQDEVRLSQEAEAEAALNKEMDSLRNKYGKFDEEQILLRMVHKGLSAEDAYKEYEGMVSQIRSTRPAPMLLGQGGSIPRQGVDPRSLNSKDTKDLVANILKQTLGER